MPKFTVTAQRLAGFAVSTAKDGEDVKVLVRRYAHLLAKTNIPTAFISKALVLLHDDNMADIYVNDFAEIAGVRVTRDMKAGEAVSKADISEITFLKFPDIQITNKEQLFM
jgi:hypothetical protein